MANEKRLSSEQATRAITLLMELVSPEPNTGCWLWLGIVEPNGYARFRTCGLRSGHRASYTLFVGSIPSDKEIDHLCRVRSCVNPQHLRVVTHQENMRRRVDAHPAACPQGHPYTAENTYLIQRKTRYRSWPERRCRICALARARVA